jgi:DNA-binding CsgD family transcriptional regulator
MVLKDPPQTAEAHAVFGKSDQPVISPAPRLFSHMEALCSGHPSLVFAGYALSWLTHLSNASIALYYTVDRRMVKYNDVVVMANGSHTPTATVEASIASYRQRFDALDPFAPRRYATGAIGVIDATDLGPAHALAGSPYFSEYLQGLGMQRQTTLHLRADGQITAGLDLLRQADDRDGKDEVLAVLRAGQAMIEYAHHCARATAAPISGVVSPGPADLTSRQREIAQLVARGASNAEVGRALTISESTVKTHLLHIYEKLNVRSRTQLVAALSGAA